jgi:hypothetical protein
MWYQERKGKSTDTTTPHFQLCCNNGKVQLPLLREPPQILSQLLFDQNSVESKNFKKIPEFITQCLHSHLLE